MGETRAMKLSANIQMQLDQFEATGNVHVYVVAVLQGSLVCIAVPIGAEGKPTRNPMTTLLPESLTGHIDPWRDATEPFTFMIADLPYHHMAWIPEVQAIQ